MYYLIGVGGIGMSALAGYLLEKGEVVAGSDSQDSEMITKLRAIGLTFFNSHDQKNINSKITCVIYTSAISQNNPELEQARKLSIKTIKRGEFLAEIFNQFHVRIAVAGTHGKSTTSALIVHILNKLNLNPNYLIGAISLNTNTHYSYKKSKIIVVEADESDGSFLALNPSISIINNIDNDHIENYGSVFNLIDSFQKFSIQSQRSIWGFKAEKYKKHGIGVSSIVKVNSLSYSTEGLELDLIINEIQYFFKSSLIGDYNVQNIVSALGVILYYLPDVNINLVQEAIATFTGTKKRMEQLSTNPRVYLDYAHHPSAIKEVIIAMKKIYKTPLFIHQPHRFSRVRSTWEEYIESLTEADNLWLLPIYSAGEISLDQNTTSQKLAQAVNSPGVKYIDTFNLNCSDLIMYDVIVFMGAGNIESVARNWIANG
jgi:UDP-N-acetylmuramate--alanine ligase